MKVCFQPKYGVSAGLLPLVLYALFPEQAGARPVETQKRVGVVLDGPSEPAEALVGLSRTEVERFGYDQKVLFSEAPRIGDYTVSTARERFEQALLDPGIDIVWAFGPTLSALAVERALSGDLPKPVVAPFVFDGPSRRLRSQDRTSSNLAYVVFAPALSRDLETLASALPVRKVAYLLANPTRAAIPELDAALRSEADKVGVDLHVVSDRNPSSMVQGLPRDIDAVYVGFDPQRTGPELDELAAALIRRGLPSFSQVGRLEVQRGLLIGLGNPENALRLARAVAVHTDAILRGETPGNLRYAFQRSENLVINAATARRLELTLPWTVLTEAELLAKDEGIEAEELSLPQVVKEVRRQNLTIRASEQEVASSEQSVGEAWGALLPQLETSVTGSWVDPDGANGINPERSATWSGTASQVIVNEPAVAQLNINENLRDASRFDNEATVLDLTEDASIAYLDVLRTLVSEEIQRENLRLTKTQIAQAQIRLEVGTGAQSELFRLQNQLANNRTSVIDAGASRKVAEIELLRLLNRASEDAIRLTDVSLESLPLMKNGMRLQSYMAGPRRFRELRGFMAEAALRYLPELRAAEARLAAQQRQVLSTQLAIFVPRVAVNGTVTSLLASDGAGTSPEEQRIFPQNDLNWQLGVSASLPLWEGNARYRRVGRAEADVRKLALDLEALKIRVQTNLRSRLHRAGASYAAIEFQQDAAEAANQNLKLVQESYARGKEDIITLVDAQNQALTGRLNANTAVYNFLIDLVGVQRAMGRFALLLSDDEVDEFFAELESSANPKGVQP